MPVVFRWKGYKFFFFSNEGDPREPLHVHVRSNGTRAKFWIKPVALAENIGFSAHELNSLIGEALAKLRPRAKSTAFEGKKSWVRAAIAGKMWVI